MPHCSFKINVEAKAGATTTHDLTLLDAPVTINLKSLQILHLPYQSQHLSNI
jgi:hypothetical protein